MKSTFQSLIDKLSFLKKNGIMYQVLLCVGLVLVLAIIFSYKSFSVHFFASNKAVISERMLTTLNMLAKTDLKAIESSDKNKLEKTIEDMKSDKAILSVTFYDKNGEAITEEPQLEPDTFFSVSKTVLAKDHKPAGKITVQISNEYIISKVKDTLNKNIFLISRVLIIVLIAFVFIFNLIVLKPLKEIKRVIRLLSAGDMTAKASVNSTGEIKAIANDLNTMIDRLGDLVSTIIKNSSLLASSSEEFSATSKESVKGASEQTSKIEKAFDSIQVFHEVIEGIFKSSTNAENQVKDATDAATSGQEIITNTMEKMEHTSTSVVNAAEKVNDLGESSKQIGNITAVIREITNKTNLLALNAAIEAARAGEHGLGFAVVADEVRKLAERTTNATKEIETTILNIQGATDSVVDLMGKTTTEVKESSALVQNAGDALKKISDGITSVSEEIRTIVSALDLQKKTTDGIINDMERVSNVAQGFTISAMEASKASNELSKMASELETVAHNFKISSS